MDDDVTSLAALRKTNSAHPHRFREYSRRRDNLAYSFLLDGEAVDAEHTARLLVLRDQDVIVAEKQKDDDVAHVPVAAQRKPGSAASPAAPGAAAPGAAAETGDALEDPGGVPSGPVAHGNGQGVAGSTSVVTRDASEDVLAAVARAVDDDGDDDASARALRRTLAAASPARLAKTVSATTVDALGTTFARFSRGAGPAGRVVVVSGLAASATSIDVATLLEPHGAVEACALVAGGGAACARFEAAEAANRAVVAGATEASGTRVAVAHLVAALPPPPRPPPGAASAGGTAMPAAPAEAGGGSGEAAARAAGAAGGGATAAGGWAPQARPTTVVCRWVVPDFETARRSDAARAHKGMYHDAGFVDAAGNRWLLYYFLDGDGADNAGHVSLYLSVRDAATLPFGWQKHATRVAPRSCAPMHVPTAAPAQVHHVCRPCVGRRLTWICEMGNTGLPRRAATRSPGLGLAEVCCARRAACARPHRHRRRTPRARDCHCQCVVDGHRAQRRRRMPARGCAYGRRRRGPSVLACRRRRGTPRRRRWLGTNTATPRVRARPPRGCGRGGGGNCARARGRRC